MITKLLRRFGYIKADFGYTCGRHYVVLDGKTIAQTGGDDIWMRDDDICDLGRAIVPGCKEAWANPADRSLFTEATNNLQRLQWRPGIIVRE